MKVNSFIFVCGVYFHGSFAGEHQFIQNSPRNKRDDGSLAANSGGPVAQANGPDDDESFDKNFGGPVAQTNEVDDGSFGQTSGGPVASITLASVQGSQASVAQVSQVPVSAATSLCKWVKKDKKVLSAIAYNSKSRRRRDNSPNAIVKDLYTLIANENGKTNLFGLLSDIEKLKYQVLPKENEPTTQKPKPESYGIQQPWPTSNPKAETIGPQPTPQGQNPIATVVPQQTTQGLNPTVRPQSATQGQNPPIPPATTEGGNSNPTVGPQSTSQGANTNVGLQSTSQGPNLTAASYVPSAFTQETKPDSQSSKPEVSNQKGNAIDNTVTQTTNSFKLLSSSKCDTSEDCFTKCQQTPTCNYILRSISSSVTYFFKVNGETFKEGNYTDSVYYDSYVQLCTAPPKPVEKCIHIIPNAKAKLMFDEYSKAFEKQYPNDEERSTKYHIFKDNLQIIQQLNCNKKENEAGFNTTEFADMTYNEFISESGGALFGLGDVNSKVDLAERGSKLIAKCPKLDWNDLGVVPEPRKQGKCGACYAFSTADLVASQYHIDRKLKHQTFKLSPQYLVDCMKEPVALGCNGGRPVQVLRNFTACAGKEGCNFPKEECYPYAAKKQKCKIDECQKTPKIPVRWASINDLSGPNEKEKIAALLHWGPAVAIVDADSSWQFYGGNGILHSSQCGMTQNHAVLLTGYDYSGPIPYYIIKNSWGTKWGDKGYIKLEAGKNTCAIAKTLTICCTANCQKIKDVMDAAANPNSENCAVA